MSTAHLGEVSPRPESGQHEGPEAGPYELVLELSRADSPEDAHDFHAGSRDYLVRVGEGGVKRASLPWAELLGDLAALTGGKPDEEMARRLGERMRRFLDTLDWGGHEEALERARGKGGQLRLVVRSSAAELYSLPWELVTLEGSGRHLADVPGCTLRYEWPGQRGEEARRGAAREGRVLLAWSEAGGAVPEDAHLLALMKASQEGGFAFDSRRDVLPRVSLESLDKKLREAQQAQQPVSVLHVLCHGAPLETSGPGLHGLAWNASEVRGGTKELVDGVALGAVLAPYADTLRMVVLCACHGGDGGRVAGYLGSVAQELHRAGIDMVVASRLPLSTVGSVLLAETLYQKLLVDSRSLEEALGAVRRRLRVEARSFDWASLQLYARREGEADLRPVVLRPYRGLLAFGPKDRRFFFGRSRLEAELLERVAQATRGQRPRFQVVAGASGAGKSSVVMAGLVPQLPREEWDCLVVRPGELVRTEPEVAGKRSVALRELQHRLHRVWDLEPLPTGEGASQQEVVEEVRRLRKARPERKLLLVVDQMEELFTQLGSEERQALLRAVWALGKEPELGCVVIATVRVDHFERCGEVMLDEQTRLDTVVYAEEHRLFVPQMGPEELAEAIEKPARVVGLELETGLVERLRGDVGQEPGALPLLAHALDLLWQRREGRRLTHRAYEELGGVTGGLTQTADRLYEELGEGERQQIRRLLVRLVAVKDMGSPRARERVWVEGMRPRDGEERAAFESMLEKLVTSRLLVKGGTPEGGEGKHGAWVQLAHETLLRKWKLLARWVEEDWEREQQLRELETWAEDWEENQRSADGGISYLLTGDRLGYARSLREKHGGELSPRSQQLLEMSEALRERQQEEEQQKQRALLEARARATRFFRSSFVVTAVLLVVAIAAVAIVSHLRQREREQRVLSQNTARLLLAEQYRGQDPARSLLFLREVGNAEKSQKWLTTAMDVLQRPMAGAVLRGHGGWVLSAVFSPDGHQVVTASADTTARLWSARGVPLASLEGHESYVLSAVFSPDGQRVVTASADTTARVWSAQGELLAKLEGHGNHVNSAVFSPDGQQVVTASSDGTARVWSSRGAQLAVLAGHEARVLTAAFSPDGQRVVTASEDGTARVWSIQGKTLAVLKGHEARVLSADFSSDGQRVVTASGDRTARVWTANGKTLAVLGKHQGQVVSASFSPDGEWVVTASDEGMVRVWRVQEGALFAKLEGHGGVVSKAAFSPDGTRVLTASMDGMGRVWTLDGRLLATLPGHGGGVYSAHFSPDGNRVVTASKDGTARVWSAEGALSDELEGHHGWVMKAHFSPDGQRVVTASADGTARVWSAEGEPLAKLEGHTSRVMNAVFSPDGTRVVTAALDGTSRVWSAEGEPLAKLEGHTAAFSPDGARIVTASRKTARVWSTEGEPLAVLEGHAGEVKWAAFSPDGTRVVTASEDGTARVWSAKGEPLALLEGHGSSVWTAAFSPDGTRVVTASMDGTARVWSLEGAPMVLLQGHKSGVVSAAFSSDGTRVVTASLDGTARVWGAKGELLAALDGHGDAVLSAAFSPDGERVVTASWDKTARVWSAQGALLARLEGHGAGLLWAAFSPDGERVVTSSSDGAARVWPVSFKLAMERLENATYDCLTSEERQTYLDETPEEALAGFERSQRALEQRRLSQSARPPHRAQGLTALGAPRPTVRGAP
ncbi:CHAT domain-containing protein [Archangium violaceum]|uniref:nSTAND1 domain-containing NTPase n=1 Tax=Archangium violaceum TaxID=83451 RepID=UPI0019525EAD|nr:CHAT domain-containing protein [Archangium violaceum]QRN96794.1 CHAT domain-containing protein [Archangium violaceum]